MSCWMWRISSDFPFPAGISPTSGKPRIMSWITASPSLIRYRLASFDNRAMFTGLLIPADLRTCWTEGDRLDNSASFSSTLDRAISLIVAISDRISLK